MLDDIPDYRYRQLAEALDSYGFTLDDNHYSLQDYVAYSPDKLFYFFRDKDRQGEALVLLVEDYIPDLDYVKNCFDKELDSRMIKLHETLKGKGVAEFKDQETIGSTDHWDELIPYVVDFPPFYSGFLATIAPHNPEKFWAELHETLGDFWTKLHTELK